ncbi:MAG: hypothetical protein ACK4QP_18765 [Pseudorhizobium sp.]
MNDLCRISNRRRSKPIPLLKDGVLNQARISVDRSRARRRSGHRPHHHELVDRFAFERWVELDTLACTLAMQEQVIGAFQHRDREPVLHPAI